MTLRQKQSKFVRLVAKLIQYASEQGYEMTFGETYRTPEQAAWNAAQVPPVGSANSLHTKRLAVDLNLFKDTDGDGDLDYLEKTEFHRPLGEWWERLDPDCRWGGRFKRPDGNHYSLAHEGIA